MDDQQLTQTVEYYCQSAAGAEGTKYTYTESVKYNSTFSFTSAKATSCYNSTNHSSTIYTSNTGTGTKTISYTVTSANTNTAYFHRNTRTITLAAGTGINSVSASGTGVKSSSGNVYTVYYGGAVTLAATPSTGYSWLKWTNTSGGTDFSTTQGYSFSSVTSNYSLTANGQRTLYTVSLTRNGVKNVTFTNTTTDTSRCPTRSTVSATSTTLCYGVSYTITMVPNDNYEFESWSTAANGTLGNANSASTTYTVTGATTLTANAKSSKTYIQDLTLTNCSSLAASANYTVYDKRDNKDYTVRYINGACWMTQNLRFTETSLDPSTSNVNTAKTVTYYSLKTDDHYSGKCYEDDGNDGYGPGYYNACIADSGNTTQGVWYNFVAANIGVCPAGWRLPSNADFNNLLSSNTNKTAFGGVTGGYYQNQSIRATSYGYWRSSNHYTLQYYYGGTYYSPSSSADPYGFFVRCIRTS